MDIFQGETIGFAVQKENGGSFEGFAVSAALRPIHSGLLRDHCCAKSAVQWSEEEVDIMYAEASEDEVAVWELTTEQSASLPEGRYAVEIALRDKSTNKVTKQASKTEILNVKRSYIR